MWVSWRHQFCGAGFVLGALAFLGGASFLSIYLFVAVGQAKGSAKELLLGKVRT